MNIYCMILGSVRAKVRLNYISQYYFRQNEGSAIVYCREKIK